MQMDWARVSTNDQNIVLRRQALERTGYELRLARGI
ncbi:DNA invertase [Enterobacter cloacae]|nr:DNA invertase [Enterobacter cloacae]